MSQDDELGPRRADPAPSPVNLPPEEYTPDGDWLEIGNEFATVAVRRVLTRNGARLQIRSSKLDTEIFVDSVLLESFTWQTSESLSLFLETPLEPFRSEST